MISFTFCIPIYRARLYFVAAKVMADGMAILPKHLSTQMKGFDDCAAGYSCLYPDYAIVTTPSLNSIAHEIGHVCRKLMDDIGFTITADNDEPLAYLEDWMTEQIHNRILK